MAIPDLVDRLTALDPARISSADGWSVARTFHHLAQGVEFSLVGYPELRHPLFRATVGRAAFHLFHRRGQMRHAVDQIIPGEAVVDGDADVGKSRLIGALAEFQTAEALHPHFAYGRLSKPQYAAAHAMHVADHLDAFRI